MGPVWALMLLLPIAQGDEPCDVSENDTLCYGALGGSIEIRLMNNGTEQWEWRKKDQRIFYWKNNKGYSKLLEARSKFNPSTGIFQMQHLSKDDSDSYTLLFYKEGRISKTLAHYLTIEALVSSVNLEPQCLSEGELKVTCSADGDSPEFSWTLIGQNLTDSQLLLKDHKNDTIILKQNTEGWLRCTVTNHVSKVYKEINLPICEYDDCTVNGTNISKWVFKNNTRCVEQISTPAPNSSGGKTSTLTPFTSKTPTSTTAPDPWWIRHLPVMVGALVGVLVLVMTTVALICVLKKKCKKNKDEEHELTYADVRILRQPARGPQERAPETEVEYGQVKFSNQNPQVPEAADNACIYAKVRR